MKTIIITLIVLLAACTEHTVYQETEEDDMAKKQGWQQAGQLTMNDTSKRVSMQANFLDNVQNYTVQLRIAGDLRYKRSRADIVWSVEGNDIRRTISVSDGASIQGAGQGVKVTLYDVSGRTAPAGIASDYNGYILVVPGTRGSSGNPPVLSGDEGTIGAAAGATVLLPENAGIVSVSVSIYAANNLPLAENSVAVQQQDFGGTNLQAYDPRTQYWVPLAPGCTQLRISNFSAAAILYKVNYGIDG